MRKVLGAVLLVACGDPAGAFLGTWKGNASMTITPSTGSPRTVAVGGVTETLTENVNTGAIDFSECGWTAKVVDGSHLTMNPSDSACITTSNGCTSSQTLATGHVTIKGAAMTWDYGGSLDTNCSGSVELATYTAHADMVKQ